MQRSQIATSSRGASGWSSGIGVGAVRKCVVLSVFVTRRDLSAVAFDVRALPKATAPAGGTIGSGGHRHRSATPQANRNRSLFRSPADPARSE